MFYRLLLLLCYFCVFCVTVLIFVLLPEWRIKLYGILKMVEVYIEIIDRLFISSFWGLRSDTNATIPYFNVTRRLRYVVRQKLKLTRVNGAPIRISCTNGKYDRMSQCHRNESTVTKLATCHQGHLAAIHAGKCIGLHRRTSLRTTRRTTNYKLNNADSHIL